MRAGCHSAQRRVTAGRPVAGSDTRPRPTGPRRASSPAVALEGEPPWRPSLAASALRGTYARRPAGRDVPDRRLRRPTPRPRGRPRRRHRRRRRRCATLPRPRRRPRLLPPNPRRPPRPRRSPWPACRRAMSRSDPGCARRHGHGRPARPLPAARRGGVAEVRPAAPEGHAADGHRRAGRRLRLLVARGRPGRVRAPRGRRLRLGGDRRPRRDPVGRAGGRRHARLRAGVGAGGPPRAQARRREGRGGRPERLRHRPVQADAQRPRRSTSPARAW